MNKILVFDTETGGLDPAEHSLLTLGAVILGSDGSIISTLSLVINEGAALSVTDQALKVNGLTVEYIREKGMTPEEATRTLETWLTNNGLIRGITLAGHNVSFDIGFLKRLYRLAGRTFDKKFSYRSLCTQSIAMFLTFAGVANYTKTSLDALTSFYDIQIRQGGATGTHDALEDAIATAKLLTCLAKETKNGVSECHTISGGSVEQSTTTS